MLKKLINHAAVEFTIVPIDPMLINSGVATVSGVDMSFVQTFRLGDSSEPYIPGSSLKGVVRSYGEKICRSLRDDPVPVCLPYLTPGKEQRGEEKQASCGLRISDWKKNNKKKELPTDEIYKVSCPACRTFGSLQFRGRLETSDCYLNEESRQQSGYGLETRDGVAIDRLTGGAAGGAKFDLEVLTKGCFNARIEIKNFERWQLGLLALILRDMEQGLVRIGMGKSRGLGRFKTEVEDFSVSYYGAKNNQPNGLVGLADRCSDEEVKAYGLFPEIDPGSVLPECRMDGFLRGVYNITDDWKKHLQPGVTDLAAYLDDVKWPADIDNFTA